MRTFGCQYLTEDGEGSPSFSNSPGKIGCVICEVGLQSRTARHLCAASSTPHRNPRSGRFLRVVNKPSLYASVSWGRKTSAPLERKGGSRLTRMGSQSEPRIQGGLNFLIWTESRFHIRPGPELPSSTTRMINFTDNEWEDNSFC
jgi:hypothetical protein